MKTPREILLARHQQAQPKLDNIRQAVTAKLADDKSKKESFSFVSLLLCCSKNIWHELIFPLRPIWAGLAAVWILILAANISLNSHPEIRMAKSPPEPEMIQAARQQEQLLTELIGPAEVSVAEPQKIHLPRPSSQRAFKTMTA